MRNGDISTFFLYELLKVKAMNLREDNYCFAQPKNQKTHSDFKRSIGESVRFEGKRKTEPKKRHKIEASLLQQNQMARLAAERITAKKKNKLAEGDEIINWD